jgi:hypothetical protein
MNPCDYFVWGYFKDLVYRTILHSVQEMPAKTEAATKGSQVTLRDSELSFMYHMLL